MVRSDRITVARPRIAAVIPARMGSSRFPGKPIIPLLGMPMVEHVHRRASLCPQVDDVYVATCDREIAEVVAAFGGRVIVTSDRHERASDRVAEAAESLDHEIVVMIQGDEPTISPSMIADAVTAMMRDDTITCVNLAAPIESLEDLENPNTIKVVTDREGRALLFTRCRIPTLNGDQIRGAAVSKQVCVIPFRRAALRKFATLEPTPLERAESVDMLRFLEHGWPVHMVPTRSGSHAVDVRGDVLIVEALLRKDEITSSYMKVADAAGGSV
jgi:3-deoxy-manno-octulosonate cytidylyltransferase (CMP-KDO synthetase)